MTLASNDLDDIVFEASVSNARHHWISVAAYYRSEARGFAPGLELDDWLAAEREYSEMLIAAYLSIIEEDGVMTMVSLRQLAEAIGVTNSEQMNIKVDLIRAIQYMSRTRSCFQIDPGNPCQEVSGCQWKTECLKMIAVWKR